MYIIKCFPRALIGYSVSEYPSPFTIHFPVCCSRKFGLVVLTGKALSFDSNLSIKPVKTFFVCKCKLSLSLALLSLVDLLINKLKTKFNNLFLQNDFKYK